MKQRRLLLALVLAELCALPIAFAAKHDVSQESTAPATTQVSYLTENIEGVNVFYRESGPRGAPVLLLLHGFPTSSHMFRDLIPRLADKYRVIAPDYPGYGFSAQPERTSFAYTFDNYATIVDKLMRKVGAERYAVYVMDYGAPVGFRLATRNPERVTALIIQNGNAYDEGFGKTFWAPIMTYWQSHADKDREAIRWLTTMKATHWQYTNGVKNLSRVSPDAQTLDQTLLDRPGNADVQLDLFYDYRTNVPLYPQWHAYFRERQPPTLIVWGKNDEIFVAAGAEPYKHDLPHAEIHMLDTGHFALETHGPEIAALIRDFLGRSLPVRSASR
jgi:pimeloyl-ACP methyl ester carboxylesterase